MKTLATLCKAILWSWLLIASPFAVAGHAVDGHLQTVVFDVQGMQTPMCPRLLEASARGIPGIVSASASFTARQATIRFDPDRLTTRQIADRILDDAGFAMIESGSSASREFGDAP